MHYLVLSRSLKYACNCMSLGNHPSIPALVVYRLAFGQDMVHSHLLPFIKPVKCVSCYTAIKNTAAYRSGKDKLLHDLVSLDILPQLVESAAARRRAEEKQAAIEAVPKKRSSRLQVCPPQACLQCH